MSDSSLEDDTWISWFCSLRGNKFFCEVDRSYIEDNFNLYGLKQVIPNYNEALNIILDRATESDDESDLSHQAMDLYGLIHARFILTGRGLDAMMRKYLATDFGFCPRMLCQSQAVVPAGRSDDLHRDWLYQFCPKCQDLYVVNGEEPTDGAYIGTSFAHLFFLTYPELEPNPGTEIYVPRVFGYRIRKPNGRRKTVRTETTVTVETSEKKVIKENDSVPVAEDEVLEDVAQETVVEQKIVVTKQVVAAAAAALELSGALQGVDDDATRSKKRKSENQA